MRSNVVAEIDPGDGSLGGQVELGGPPSAIAVAPDAIWVAGDADGTVSRIDPKTHTIRDTNTVGHGQSTLAADRGGVWAANREDGRLTRISSATNRIVDRFDAVSPTGVCLLGGEVWVAGAAAGGVLRYDPERRGNAPSRSETNPSALACGAGGVWAVAGGRLMRIDPATGLARRAGDVGDGVSALAVSDKAVWAANPLTGIVSRVDPERGVVTKTYAFGPDDEPVALAVGAGGVWVANRRARTVARIDPEQTVGKAFPIGRDPRALAVVDGRLWVAVAATAAGQRGGTLRVDVQGSKLSPVEFDPATSYTPWGWEVLTATNDGLTTYRRAGGVAGATLLPNLAESLPSPVGRRAHVRVHAAPGRALLDRPAGARDRREARHRAVDEACRFARGRPAARPRVDHGRRRQEDHRVPAQAPGPGLPPTSLRSRSPPRCRPARRLRPRSWRRPAPTGSQRMSRGDGSGSSATATIRQWSALARPDGYPDVIDVRLGVKADEAIGAVRAGRRDVAHMTSAVPEMARLRRRDPGPIRDTVAPRDVVGLPEHPRAAVQRRQRPPRREPRDRSPRDRRGRGACRPGHVSDHPARPSRLPAVLPAARARPCRSAATGRALRHTRRTGDPVDRGGVRAGDPAGGARPALPRLPHARASAAVRSARRRGLRFDNARAGRSVGLGRPTIQRRRRSSAAFRVAASCRAARRTPTISQFCDPRADDLMRRAAEQQTSDPRAADALWARAEDRVLAAAPVVPLLNLLYHRPRVDARPQRSEPPVLGLAARSDVGALSRTARPAEAIRPPR